MKQRTYTAKPSDIKREWFVVDAEGIALGRLATQLATVLRGKHKPQFTPHMDTGDFVVVINAAKIRLSGNKMDTKMDHRHSGFPGGLRSRPYRELLLRDPERAIRKAVWGMLPKGTLGRAQLEKLKVYGGSEHPHSAQEPKALGRTGLIQEIS